MPGRKTHPDMTQAVSLKGWSGRGGNYYDTSEAATKVFAGAEGDFRAEQVMYLLRRFGYPIRGWDGYKDVIEYHLTTPDLDVALLCRPASDLRWSFGFVLSKAFGLEAEKAERKWFTSRATTPIESLPVYQRIDSAIRAAMTELLRPVYIRDVDYNLLGRIEDSAPYARWKAAERSPQAGYGLGGFDPRMEYKD